MCSHSSMFPQFYVPTVLCSHSFMFPQLFILQSHDDAFIRHQLTTYDANSCVKINRFSLEGCCHFTVYGEWRREDVAAMKTLRAVLT